MAGGLVPSPVPAGEKLDREIETVSDVEVSVENLAGSVVVEAWDRDVVHIGGTIGDSADYLEVEVEPHEIEISVDAGDGWNRWDTYEETDLKIRVPRNASVSVETVSARVSVEGVQGEVEVDTVSGMVRMTGGREAYLESVSGQISVEGVEGDISVESVSGLVAVEGCSGTGEIATTSGSIKVTRDCSFRDLEVESVSGLMDLDLTPLENGSYSIENLSGPIDVMLPEDLDAVIDVETFSGQVVSQFRGRSGEEEYGPGAWFRGEFGNGSAEIYIESFSGQVHLNKR
ncbi:MAG: DUF4097 family beta strand repeat protein [Gemmatimonadetes bacterium]|nr:DUF4097 family beta strand repeat protein [Gemmatimonadota bacterium]